VDDDVAFGERLEHTRAGDRTEEPNPFPDTQATDERFEPGPLRAIPDDPVLAALERRAGAGKRLDRQVVALPTEKTPRAQ
jgi:hypothetical protein